LRGKSSSFRKTKDKASYLIAFERQSGQIVYNCENSYRYLGIDNSYKKETSRYRKLSMREMCPQFYS
jgi:hypothetical protein